MSESKTIRFGPILDALLPNETLRKFIEDYKWHLIGFTSIALSLYVLRYGIFAPPKCQNNIQIKGKTVIVTGANTGIGKETALDLAKRGARVILACRNIEKGHKAANEIREKTGNHNVVVEELDLASFESIKAFAKRINQNEPQVNILINNAGVMACPYTKTKDGYETQFGVNHLGHFLLTNLLLDKLIKSAPSRIINVSSKLYESGKINWDDLNSEVNYDPMGAYKQSKLCNLLFTHELANRLEEHHNVTVHSVSPGIVLTDLGRHFNASYGYWSVIRYYLFYPLMRFIFRTPKEGAQTTVHVSTDDTIEKNKSGKLYRNCQEVDLKDHAKSREDAKRLWDLSEHFTKDYFQP